MESGLADDVWTLEELVALLDRKWDEDRGMTISTNIIGWFRLFLFASGRCLFVAQWFVSKEGRIQKQA